MDLPREAHHPSRHTRVEKRLWRSPAPQGSVDVAQKKYGTSRTRTSGPLSDALPLMQ